MPEYSDVAEAVKKRMGYRNTLLISEEPTYRLLNREEDIE